MLSGASDMRRWVVFIAVLIGVSILLAFVLVAGHVRPLYMALISIVVLLLVSGAFLRYLSHESKGMEEAPSSLSERTIDSEARRRRRGIAACWVGIVYFSLALVNALWGVAIGRKMALGGAGINLVLLVSIIAVMVRLKKAP